MFGEQVTARGPALRGGGRAFEGRGEESYSGISQVCYLGCTETIADFRGKD